LFESDADEEVEEFEFFLDGHGLWECLVAIAEVDGAPLGGGGEGVVRPGAVGQGDRWEGAVFGE
jgi:hypothetical protein